MAQSNISVAQSNINVAQSNISVAQSNTSVVQSNIYMALSIIRVWIVIAWCVSDGFLNVLYVRCGALFFVIVSLIVYYLNSR